MVTESLIPAGDVFVHLYDCPAYTNEAVEIDNSAGTADMRLQAGYPIKDEAPMEGADVTGEGKANPDALLLQATIVPAGKKKKVTVVVRGPVVVNKDALPAKDYKGASFVAADLLAAVKAGITGLVTAAESPLTSTLPT